MLSNCAKHQRQNSVYDLNIHQIICQRCALFDSRHTSHAFLQIKKLPEQSLKLYNKFIGGLNGLQLTNQNKGIVSNYIQQFCLKKICQEIAIINTTYDEIILKITKEKQQKIAIIQKEISRISEDCTNSVNLIVSENYQILSNSAQKANQMIVQKEFSEAFKLLSDENLQNKLEIIQKDLQMIYFQLKNRLGFIEFNKISNKIPVKSEDHCKQEILLSNINKQMISLSQSSLKESRVSTNSSKCSEISFGSKSKKNNISREFIECQSTQNSLNILKIHNKSELRNIYIKNNIKAISMKEIGMNNREAIQAIKKCSQNNFVSKIDLSDNHINQKILSAIKKQKIQSKYLKQIVLKGMIINIQQLRKEGFNIEKNAKGQNIVEIGNLKIIY